MKKIVIADDNKFFRQALISLLQADFEIVGEAVDGRQAIDLVGTMCPDLLLLDLSMPNLNGIRAIGEIRRHSPNLKVLVLTIYNSRHYFDTCKESGIEGYVLKDEGRHKLLDAINHVLTGKTYFSSELEAA